MSLFVNVIQIEKKLLVLLFDYFALFIGLVARKAIVGDTGCHGFMPSCSIHFLPKSTSSQQSLRPINPCFAHIATVGRQLRRSRPKISAPSLIVSGSSGLQLLKAERTSQSIWTKLRPTVRKIGHLGRRRKNSSGFTSSAQNAKRPPTYLVNTRHVRHADFATALEY